MQAYLNVVLQLLLGGEEGACYGRTQRLSERHESRQAGKAGRQAASTVRDARVADGREVVVGS